MGQGKESGGKTLYEVCACDRNVASGKETVNDEYAEGGSKTE